MAKSKKETAEFKKGEVIVLYPVDFADRNGELLRRDGWIRQAELPNLKNQTNEPDL